MKGQNSNNVPVGDDKLGKGLGDEFIADDAQPLCRKCLSVCHRLQNYRENCDSNEAINPLAAYMPFVRIRFTVGMVVKVWRIMLYDKDRLVVFRLICLLVIILFALGLLC